MPYDPSAPTEKERSNAYVMMYFGLAASLVLVVSLFVSLPSLIIGLSLMIAGSLAAVMTTSNRFDDYFMALTRTGMAWALTVVGLRLILTGLAFIYSLSYNSGFALGSGGLAPDDAEFILPAMFNDAYALAVVTSFAFYAGFAFARLRREA